MDVTPKLRVDHAKEIFRMIVGGVASPYSRKLQTLLVTDDWNAIYSSQINPSEYEHTRSLQLDLLLASYIRKYAGGANRSILREKAITSFQEVERINSKTNHTIRYSSLNWGVEGIISDARRKIERVLGDFSFDEFLSCVEWGSGATASIARSSASVDKKCLEPRLSVSRHCLKYARAYLEQDIHWMSARLHKPCEGFVHPLWTEFQIIDYGQFDVVEKDNRSMRNIDKQPTLNLFFQKGLGKMVRRRLKRRAGVDLDDQTINQRYARDAFSGNLATLDLSNASNTVSYELVRLLLLNCPDWFKVFDDTRTKSISIDGKVQKLEMFSAMGNGFTFELESLIFWALARAVADEGEAHGGIVSIYGDDIIVEQRHAGRLVTVLSECGFSVNKEKSFLSGPYYESCGKHYHRGVDVTPIFQKEVICDAPTAVRAANRLFRWAARIGSGDFVDYVAHPWYRYAASLAYRFHALSASRLTLRSRSRRPKRPPALPLQPSWLEGDGGLIDTGFMPPYDRDGIARIRVYRVTSIKNRGMSEALFAVSLRRGCVVESPFNDMVTIKDRTRVVINEQRIYCSEDEVPGWASLIN